jgi:pimeloyl-ACP methyl ester carboxylesterase
MSEFILIHGAGTGGWLWDQVADRLRRTGHVVHAPTLVGVGERVAEGGPATDVSTHVDEVVGLAEKNGVDHGVLVGFSYGGLVIAAAADEMPDRVAELVFVDAFVPQPGKSMLDLLPPPVRASMEASAEDGWRRRPAPIATVGGIGAMEPGVDESQVLTVLERRGPHPIGTYRQVFQEPFQRSQAVPRRYISCTDKPSGDPLLMTAAFLRAAGWRVQDLPTGHFAMLTMPSRLAALLAESGS